MTSLRPLLAAIGIIAGVTISAIIVFSLQPRSQIETNPQADLCTPKQPCLAIVIDDVGRDDARLATMIDLPGAITFAVLPHANETKASVARLKRAKREYLLHLPLQPHDRTKITDEPIVLSPQRSFGLELDDCLARVPGAVGVNNHMGSAFSEDRKATTKVMQVIKERGLWFLDSKTSTSSQLCAAAISSGVSCRQRDVFLDQSTDLEEIGMQLEQATRIARKRGWAIAIGHPFEATIAALHDYLAPNPPVTIVPLSQLVTTTARNAAEKISMASKPSARSCPRLGPKSARPQPRS